uniref:RNase H type-1 domain-containing protein n=1 Tax=Strongyloides stercoralis TaxID=6248 RepID=A0AAF5D306_STRER
MIAIHKEQTIIQGRKCHGNSSTQRLELEAALMAVNFLSSRTNKGLLLSDSGFICSSAQLDFKVTAFPNLWTEFQKKRGDTCIVHVSSHSGIILNDLADTLCKLYATEVISENFTWKQSLKATEESIASYKTLMDQLITDGAYLSKGITSDGKEDSSQ